jgi:thiol-disulfide isomerase/thioredoxin
MRCILALLLGAVADAATAKLRSGAMGPVATNTGLLQEDAHAMTSLLKTTAAFELDPNTFPGIINAVPTDVFLLFYSPTCPDCERLMPLWTKVAASFESNQDVTLMSVADDEGKALAPFVHTENPALFWIPKNNKANPIPFPMAKLHVFTSLPETQDTDTDMLDELMNFAYSHGASSSKAQRAPANQQATAVAQPSPQPTQQQKQQQRILHDAGPDPRQEPKVEEALNARLLATLKAHERESFQAQRQIVLEEPYDKLPVCKFLSGVTEPLPAPLAEMAAKYLDGEPLARKWAVRYAQMEIANFRSQGYWPTDSEQASHFQELIDFSLPVYARSIYVQKGGQFGGRFTGRYIDAPTR